MCYLLSSYLKTAVRQQKLSFKALEVYQFILIDSSMINDQICTPLPLRSFNKNVPKKFLQAVTEHVQSCFDNFATTLFSILIGFTSMKQTANKKINDKTLLSMNQ